MVCIKMLGICIKKYLVTKLRQHGYGKPCNSLYFMVWYVLTTDFVSIRKAGKSGSFAHKGQSRN